MRGGVEKQKYLVFKGTLGRITKNFAEETPAKCGGTGGRSLEELSRKESLRGNPELSRYRQMMQKCEECVMGGRQR